MIILIFLFFSVALGGATTVVCGPGQFYDSTITETCAPQFPAPLAFVGALMDSRYTACDISFERLMCGGAASDSPRALQYAELRYRRALRKALRQQASPWWRSCLGRPQRHETLIEYKHVAERILGDLFVPADLPAAWGRLARAGYEEAAGSPFMLHKRDGQWYLSAPSTTILELKCYIVIAAAKASLASYIFQTCPATGLGPFTWVALSHLPQRISSFAMTYSTWNGCCKMQTNPR